MVLVRCTEPADRTRPSSNQPERQASVVTARAVPPPRLGVEPVLGLHVEPPRHAVLQVQLPHVDVHLTGREQVPSDV